MQEMRENLGKVFRDARKRKGMTQEELAEQIGVQTRMILEIENGRGNPRFDNLFAALPVGRHCKKRRYLNIIKKYGIVKVSRFI